MGRANQFDDGRRSKSSSSSFQLAATGQRVFALARVWHSSESLPARIKKVPHRELDVLICGQAGSLAELKLGLVSRVVVKEEERDFVCLCSCVRERARPSRRRGLNWYRLLVGSASLAASTHNLHPRLAVGSLGAPARVASQ